MKLLIQFDEQERGTVFPTEGSFWAMVLHRVSMEVDHEVRHARMSNTMYYTGRTHFKIEGDIGYSEWHQSKPADMPNDFPALPDEIKLLEEKTENGEKE